MAKEQNDFRTAENQRTVLDFCFWRNLTYQLEGKYPNDFISAIDDAIRFLTKTRLFISLFF
jgi:hypothetical protein